MHSADQYNFISHDVIKPIEELPSNPHPWVPEEDAVLREGVLRYGLSDWASVSLHMLPRCHRSVQDCASRWLIVKGNVVKGPWLPEENQMLRRLVGKYGAKKWSTIATHIPGRVGKQCRERWLNHLDSSVKKSDWLETEDRILMDTQRVVGNKWSEIARLLPGRAENAVKNRYNSLITKKLARRITMMVQEEEKYHHHMNIHAPYPQPHTVAFETKIHGKNVLQQIFSAVQVSKPPELPGLSVYPLRRRTYMPGDLQLKLSFLDDDVDDEEICIEMDLDACDYEIPIEQLVQTKQYMDHERARAIMFQGVSLSAEELVRMEGTAKQLSPECMNILGGGLRIEMATQQSPVHETKIEQPMDTPEPIRPLTTTDHAQETPPLPYPMKQRSSQKKEEVYARHGENASPVAVVQSRGGLCTRSAMKRKLQLANADAMASSSVTSSSDGRVAPHLAPTLEIVGTRILPPSSLSEAGDKKRRRPLNDRKTTRSTFTRSAAKLGRSLDPYVQAF